MGTSTDNCGRQTSDHVIPWKCVSFCIVNELVLLLNTDSIKGDDWRGLASRLKYSTAVISSIESEKNNNTKELFKMYVREPHASFNDVYRCLEDMNRKDCVEVLENNFKEIKEAYEHYQQNSSPFHLSGGQMHSPPSAHYWSSHSTPPYGCHYMSQPITGPPAFSPHHCCSMAHGYGTATHHEACSHQALQHPMSMSAYSCMNHAAHSPKPGHYNCSQASGYFPPHLQMNVQFDAGPRPKASENTSTSSPYGNGYTDRILSNPSSRQPLARMSQNPAFDRSDSNKSYEDNNMLLAHNINPRDNSNLVSTCSSDLSNSSLTWRPMDTSLGQSQTSLLSNSSNGGAAAAMTRHYDAINSQDYDKQMDSKNCLEKLVQISKVPEEYQPTEEYTRVVAEQKIAERKNNKAGKDCDEKPNPSVASGSSSGSSRSNGSRSGASATESSNTYPLRAKIQANDMAKDFASISIRKSPSLPQSYKSQEYQKVHETRLFLSYSADSEEHKNDILSLCFFLKENQFKFYVDVKDTPADGENDKPSEYLTRLEAADHVLMCVSPKYLRDVSKADPPLPSERQLHTNQIYRQMYQEHQDDYGSRVVILLFGSITRDSLPVWMRRCLTYHWPSAYEDLFWMLMKPQDKIKASCKVTNTDKSSKYY